MIFRLRYYLCSIITLCRGVRNLPAVLWALVRRHAGGSDRAILVRLVGGFQFWVRSALDVWVLKEVVLEREYERLGPPIQSGWTVVDIGAAYGEFAIPAARRVGGGRVVAVEPAPDTYALLLQNLALNAATEVTCCALAIGAEEGVASLKLAPRGAVMNSTALSGGNSASVMVPMVSLAGLFEREHIVHCDYLKMDCEGGEYAILLSASDATLQHIDRICMEYHETGLSFTHHDLCARLAHAGFTVMSHPNRADPGQGWIYAQRGERSRGKP